MSPRKFRNPNIYSILLRGSCRQRPWQRRQTHPPPNQKTASASRGLGDISPHPTFLLSVSAATRRAVVPVPCQPSLLGLLSKALPLAPSHTQILKQPAGTPTHTSLCEPDGLLPRAWMRKPRAVIQKSPHCVSMALPPEERPRGVPRPQGTGEISPRRPHGTCG